MELRDTAPRGNIEESLLCSVDAEMVEKTDHSSTLPDFCATSNGLIGRFDKNPTVVSREEMKNTVFAFLISFVGLTANAFTDPQGFVTRLDQYLAPVDFTKAFQTGQQFDVKSEDCVGVCDTMAMRYEVANVNAQSANVLTYLHGTAKPQSTTVKKADWVSWNGNRVRYFIAIAESYGLKVTIQSLKETSITLNVNGVAKTYPALELTFEGKTVVLDEINTFTVVRDLPGAGQIAKHVKTRLGGTNTTTVTSARF